MRQGDGMGVGVGGHPYMQQLPVDMAGHGFSMPGMQHSMIPMTFSYGLPGLQQGYSVSSSGDRGGLDGMEAMGFRSQPPLADPYGRQAQMQGGLPQGYGVQQAMSRQAYPQGPYAQPIWASNPVQQMQQMQQMQAQQVQLQQRSQPKPKTAQQPRRTQKGMEEKIKRTIYISSIDLKVTEADLANFFADCGRVLDCRICGDPNSAMRFAFIEFQSTDAVPSAMSRTGIMLGRLQLRVLQSKTAIVPVSKELMPRSHEEIERCGRTVYVANIDKKVERADVHAFFQQLCGKISKLRLLGDHAHPTRIAFVEFETADGAVAALNCSGAVLGSLPIRVSPSKTPVRPNAGVADAHGQGKGRRGSIAHGGGAGMADGGMADGGMAGSPTAFAIPGMSARAAARSVSEDMDLATAVAAAAAAASARAAGAGGDRDAAAPATVEQPHPHTLVGVARISIGSEAARKSGGSEGLQPQTPGHEREGAGVEDRIDSGDGRGGGSAGAAAACASELAAAMAELRVKAAAAVGDVAVAACAGMHAADVVGGVDAAEAGPRDLAQ